MRVKLQWEMLHEEHERWSSNCAIYAYLHPRCSEILYIGKVDGTSVRSRWHADDKRGGLWRDLEQQRCIHEHRVLAANLFVDTRLTRQLVADVESLLIFAVKPWGNISALRSRISRPGLEVINIGSCWPGADRVRDLG